MLTIQPPPCAVMGGRNAAMLRPSPRDVVVQQPSPIVGRDLLEYSADAHAGMVDEQIDPARHLERASRKCLHGLIRREVNG